VLFSFHSSPEARSGVGAGVWSRGYVHVIYTPLIPESKFNKGARYHDSRFYCDTELGQYYHINFEYFYRTAYSMQVSLLHVKPQQPLYLRTK